MVDGVILVVASGTTARGALARAHRILENAGSRVLGMVLNKVDMRFDTYYGSYYGSYYGPYHQGYYDEIAVSNPSHSPGGGRARSKDSPRRSMSIQSRRANESGFPPQARREGVPRHSALVASRIIHEMSQLPNPDLSGERMSFLRNSNHTFEWSLRPAWRVTLFLIPIIAGSVWLSHEAIRRGEGNLPG